MEDCLPLRKIMTRLIFIRHGQSVANEQGRFAGQTNVALTELGKAQAERAAEYITKRERIDKIYSSDLCRAHDTALPASKILGLPINDVKELREICAGVWEGRLVSEIQVERRTLPAHPLARISDTRGRLQFARVRMGENVRRSVRKQFRYQYFRIRPRKQLYLYGRKRYY